MLANQQLPPAPTCPICGKPYSVVKNNIIRPNEIIYGNMPQHIYDRSKHVCDLIDIQKFKASQKGLK